MTQLQAAMEVKLKFVGAIHEWCRSQSEARRNTIGVACAARSRHHRAIRKIIMQNRIPIRCDRRKIDALSYRPIMQCCAEPASAKDIASSQLLSTN
jgi:hypothetical protein